MTVSTPAAPSLTTAIAIRVFVPFALGYFLSYLYRVVNAVIAPDLVADLGLGASALGLLTAAYFLTFAAFQLPLGVLLDHYGPRKIEAGLLVFAALGAALFAMAESVTSLILARGLIGFGVSACLMAAFKAYVQWFPKERLALINGFQMTAGGLGALAATQPVEMALGFTDWRGVFWILAGLTLIAAFAILFVVPERKIERHADAKLKDAWAGVVEVFTSPVFWRAAPLCMFSQAAFLTIQGLWSGPWLKDVGGLARTDVATHLFWIAAAMVAGFFTWGIVAERLHKIKGVPTMTTAAIGMAGFLCMQVVIALELTVGNPTLTFLAWVAFGFLATSGILPYAALSQAFPANLAGRVNTAINLLVFVLAFAGQWAVGGIIDLWPQTAAGGYDPAGFQAAFGAMIVLQAFAMIWYLAKSRGRI
ncbi:MFS transporter [Magnetovibrio sp. PR-2]|uniref:MFS transporter n=1 Tax=Magnetovibrio sp. PR-2 TaxID=3120356 RepID=UPI002FCE1A58